MSRKVEEQGLLRVKAVGGTHVVIVAWDIAQGQHPKADLLGFAIERAEYDKHDTVVEKYWLRGIKRFKDKDEGLAAGTPVPTSEHPVQSFLWGDYTVKPGTKYAFRIVPVYGQPKLLTLDDGGACSVAITTERETEPTDAAGVRHDVHFNRGVIGSQAYARRFSNAAPDPDKPESEEMKWLSRGLYEALVGFIGKAKNSHWALRAAVYEFHYQPVVDAFATAKGNGADVKIVYDAEDGYTAANQQAIAKAGIEAITIPRTVTEGIRHNKFIVLLHDGKPKAVWTGSTNISDGGIFGHSNVGHVVWDDDIAATYLKYWEQLATAKTTPTKLRDPLTQLTPRPAGKPDPGVTLLFSPRDPAKPSPTLQWYADRMADASRLVCFTVAFDLDPVFQQVIQNSHDVLTYIVKDDKLKATENIGVSHDVLFAAGGRLEEGALANFLEESVNPLNSNRYIHTKIMLVDPLGADPMVITGSANFSSASQISNDENMLVIRGNTRVADIYFGEYMRVFDHHYARYIVTLLASPPNPDAGYLKAEQKGWYPSHFNPESYKSKRRTYFVE